MTTLIVGGVRLKATSNLDWIQSQLKFLIGTGQPLELWAEDEKGVRTWVHIPAGAPILVQEDPDPPALH